MNITFVSLTESHYPLLLKWLEAPHVKAWWDPDVTWTPELIREKYGTYVKGYKFQNGIPKPIQAFIIHVDEIPVGYVQLYNAYDFHRGEPLMDLPESLAAVDIYIGESSFLGKGIGSQALVMFLEKYCDDQYEAVFVDPHRENIAAIKTYENAGFHKVRVNGETGVVGRSKSPMLLPRTKHLQILPRGHPMHL